MKRLFEVNGEYFADKKAAKAARGAPKVPADGKTPAQYAHDVQLGPDHWKRGGMLASAPKPVKRVRAKKKVETAAE